MRRAYLIELTVFRDYGKQLLALGFLVAVLVGCGMQTVLAAPSIITCMFFMMGAMGDTIAEVVGTEPSAPREPEPIVRSVADLLDDLIEQSVQLVGTPVALMSKEEKVRAIRYLNDTGAFLITKSGPKVCKFFGISKYTLYNYLDEARSDEKG